MYLPAFSEIAQSLGVDMATVGYSLTSYFIGISIGQLLYGPIIDRFGRKPPLLFGLVLYLISALGCAWAASADMLIGMRFLQALGGCVGMVAGRAIIRDLFPPGEIANVFSSLILVMGVAPIIAPTVGGLVTAEFGWRTLFYILAGLALLLILLVGLVLPESKGADNRVSLAPNRILKDWKSVLQNPAFIAFTLVSSISFGGLFAYIAGSPFVFMEYFNLSETQYGWAFGFNAFGFILGSQINRFWLKKQSGLRITLTNATIQLGVGIALVIGTYSGAFGPVLTLSCIWVFLFCQGVITPNATALALAPITQAIGSASALMGSIQMISGAIISGLVSLFFNGTPQPMATAMFGSTLVSFIILMTFLSRRKQASVVSAV
jgi:DHA1 family bicyclomycin/chloramphenicol resistance-like MFS transporter